MENSWGKARVQHLTCAHQFLDMIHATQAALSGNTASPTMKGSCCGVRKPGEITGSSSFTGEVAGALMRGDTDQGERQYH